MLPRWLLLVSLVLASGLHHAAAQTTPPVVADTYATTSTLPTTPYTIERDSLWRRAALVRARTQARIVRFRTSFAALGGTRRKVVSYGKLKVKNQAVGSLAASRVKRQINKHKTTGSELEKIFYYGAGNRLLLAEYYQQQQLVRLELHEYPMRAGNEVETAYRTTNWLLGDYLQLITHVQGDKKAVRQQYYFTEPRK